MGLVAVIIGDMRSKEREYKYYGELLTAVANVDYVRDEHIGMAGRGALSQLMCTEPSESGVPCSFVFNRLFLAPKPSTC